MKLKEVFDQLSYGELSMLSIGEAKQGVIDGTNFQRVLVHVNPGLTALHKRFFLKEERIVIPLVPGTLEYELPVQVLKVERVLTDGTACNGEPVEFSLNDVNEKYSVFTPYARILRIHPEITEQAGECLPDVLKTKSIEIVYRADHPKLIYDSGYFNPDDIEINLPDSHLMALCYFIASRVHNPIGMVNEFHMGNSFYTKYEMECRMLEEQGMRIDRDGGNIRLRAKGWV